MGGKLNGRARTAASPLVTEQRYSSGRQRHGNSILPSSSIIHSTLSPALHRLCSSAVERVAAALFLPLRPPVNGSSSNEPMYVRMEKGGRKEKEGGQEEGELETLDCNALTTFLLSACPTLRCFSGLPRSPRRRRQQQRPARRILLGGHGRTEGNEASSVG